jgi:outer membrane protein OmpA-like peptidoglycan-associated protein
VDRRYVAELASKFPKSPTEAPITYKEPPKGATPIVTQRKSIYFDPNSANMGLDSRAVVDEIGDFMRAYENTVVDIEGNTDSSGSREMNMTLSKQRADAVKDYLVAKYHFPPDRMRTIGNGPDRPLDTNDTPEGREKNRRTDIKAYPNPASKQ